MRAAKAFAFVSLGILALAGAVALGAQTATGQPPGNPVVAMSSGFVVTSNGDVYYSPNPADTPFIFAQNVFGAPTQATETTWGRVKADRR